MSFGAYYEFQPHQVYSGYGNCCGFRGFAFGADAPAVTVADAASTTAPTTSDGTTSPVTTLKDATSTVPATTAPATTAPATTATPTPAIVLPTVSLPAPSTVPKMVKYGFIGLLGLAALKTLMK